MSQAGILQEQAIVILPSSAPALILQVCYEGIAHGKQKVHRFTLCNMLIVTMFFDLVSWLSRKYWMCHPHMIKASQGYCNARHPAMG